jgi:hypothetical protein
VKAARERGLAISPAAEVCETPGTGVSGTVGGRRCAIGSGSYVRSQGIALPEKQDAERARLSQAGKTIALVGVDSHLAGMLVFEDTVRPEAPATMRRLREAGITRIVMLTGDAPETARTVAARIGIPDARSRLQPEEKLAAIREMAAHGPVMMVGDGIIRGDRLPSQLPTLAWPWAATAPASPPRQRLPPGGGRGHHRRERGESGGHSPARAPYGQRRAAGHLLRHGRQPRPDVPGQPGLRAAGRRRPPARRAGPGRNPECAARAVGMAAGASERPALLEHKQWLVRHAGVWTLAQRLQKLTQAFPQCPLCGARIVDDL